MIGFDTNVLVRIFVDDDPEQSRRARRLFEREGLLLTPVVVLETEWVLRRRYEFAPKDIARALRAVGGAPNVVVEAAETIRAALDLYEGGFDLADALHLQSAKSAGCVAFATFDGSLRKRAARRKIGCEVISP